MKWLNMSKVGVEDSKVVVVWAQNKLCELKTGHFDSFVLEIGWKVNGNKSDMSKMGCLG
jgi:hypothetical protein